MLGQNLTKIGGGKDPGMISSTGTTRRVLFPLTAAIILGFFLFFTWPSFRLYFDQDDMYNLYFAWSKPASQLLRENLFFWQGAPRPLGQLFYRGVFSLAGFHPLPFRVAAVTLCTVNLGLCYRVTELISASRRVAALATLLSTFHNGLIEVWYRTAMIFDVLCFTFVWLAVALYISARRSTARLSSLRLLAIVILYWCALDAKEMAIVLPVLLFAWELIFNTAGLKRFLRSRALVLILGMGLMTLAYIHGKLSGPDAMTNNPFYLPEYSLARLEHNWNRYLADLLLLPKNPTGWWLISIAGALMAMACATSRTLAFASIVIIAGLLPITFTPDRSGYVLYFSWIGLVLFAALLLVRLEDLITVRRPQYRLAAACAVFILVGWRYGKIQLHTYRVDPRHWLYDGPASVRALAQQIASMHPTLPPGSHLLFEEDGFTTREFTPMFILRLLYRDPNLVVDRAKLRTNKPANWDQYNSPAGTRYGFVFTWENGTYRQIQH
jgi:hypothetical protein